MTDNELFTALIAEIKTQLDAYGLTDYAVKRNYQPGARNAGNGPVIYLHSVSVQNIGRGLDYSWASGEFEQSNYKARTIQVDVIYTPDVSDETALLAEDIAGALADLLQSQAAIEALRAEGVRVENVSSPRPVFTVNQSDQYESTPGFDLRVTYSNTYSRAFNPADSVTTNIERV